MEFSRKRERQRSFSGRENRYESLSVIRTGFRFFILSNSRTCFEWAEVGASGFGTSRRRYPRERKFLQATAVVFLSIAYIFEPGNKDRVTWVEKIKYPGNLSLLPR